MKSEQKRKQPAYKCVLCHKTFTGYGNNPASLVFHGRCCNECNYAVIAERVRLLRQSR